LPEGSLLPFAPSRTETGAQGSQDKHGNDECLRLPSELTSRKTIAGVHALPAGTALRVPNTGARHRAALALDRGGTGRAHRLRADQPLPSGAGVLLAAAGLPLAPVNPLKARRFAQAPGLQAKTDKTCARMLAEMGLRLTPGLQVPNPANLHRLKDLVAARRALVADRVADGNRTGGHSLALLQRIARRRRAAIEADITRIEAAIAALIAADPAPGRTRPASCKACPASLP